MSYSSRVYRQRNAHTYDNENKPGQDSFFDSGKEHTHASSGKGVFFQAKLSIGEPNDKYEKEADRVADKVVNHKSGDATAIQEKEISGIQRYATPVEDEKYATNDERMKHDKDIQEKPEVQAKCTECEKEDKDKAGIHKKSENGSSSASPSFSSTVVKSAGNGKKLPLKTLHEMNRSFGADFSTVKIHADSEAVSMNRFIHAQAFTYGNDIYFNEGKFNPDTADGKFLLAHELTHVIQQNDNEKVQRSGISFIQAACEDKSFKTCGGACTHPTSGYAGTCRWTGLTNGCKCFENPRSTRSLEEVLPYWIMALLTVAAIAALAACFASGVCEAGIIIGAAGAAVGAIIIGIFRSAGVQVNGDDETA